MADPSSEARHCPTSPSPPYEFVARGEGKLDVARQRVRLFAMGRNGGRRESRDAFESID
jgi:hypothetical protein